MLAGLTEKQVAARLNVNEHTVHWYVKWIYRFFRVHSRAQLSARLQRLGLQR
jgi:DNA-binding CsgD family transcriptional regulator